MPNPPMQLTEEQTLSLFALLDKDAPLRPDEEMPARMVGYKAPEDIDGEAVRQREESRKARRARSASQRRAREARQDRVDELVEASDPLNVADVTQAWEVAALLLDTVVTVVTAKARWMERLVGTCADDIAQDVIADVVTATCRSEFDHGVLLDAAEWLASGGDAPSEESGPARKWLMQVINRRTNCRLADAYRALESYEMAGVIDASLATVEAGIHDAFLNNFRADRGMRRTSAHVRGPGELDQQALAVAINAAIGEHRLDALTELFLDPDCLRTDGTFRWTEFAELVFDRTGDSALWTVVSTTVPRTEQGRVAQAYARKAFEWLPRLVCDAADAIGEIGEIRRVTYCAKDAIDVIEFA